MTTAHPQYHSLVHVLNTPQYSTAEVMAGISGPSNLCLWCLPKKMPTCFPGSSSNIIVGHVNGSAGVSSRERIHIPPWEKEHHLQKRLLMGYVSSQEGICLGILCRWFHVAQQIGVTLGNHHESHTGKLHGNGLNQWYHYLSIHGCYGLLWAWILSISGSLEAAPLTNKKRQPTVATQCLYQKTYSTFLMNTIYIYMYICPKTTLS